MGTLKTKPVTIPCAAKLDDWVVSGCVISCDAVGCGGFNILVDKFVLGVLAVSGLVIFGTVILLINSALVG